MSFPVESFERAGCYTESHQGGIAPTDLTLTCAACGKALLPVPAGDTTFTQTHGDCTCSWGCCEISQSTNRRHPRHLVYREAL